MCSKTAREFGAHLKTGHHGAKWATIGLMTDGFVTLPCRGREVSVHQELSGRTDGLAPRAHRRGAKRAMGPG